METGTVIALSAAALAVIALFRKPQTVVQQVGNGGVPSIQLGAGPTFNINRANGNGQYMGDGGYPPFNSCGCGRAMNGVMLTPRLAPVYGDAIVNVPGVKTPQPVGGPVQLELIGNGAVY